MITLMRSIERSEFTLSTMMVMQGQIPDDGIIPEEGLPMFVIDGGHRFEALRRLYSEDLALEVKVDLYCYMPPEYQLFAVACKFLVVYFGFDS